MLAKLEMLQISFGGYGNYDKPLIHTVSICLRDAIQLLLLKYNKLDFTLQPVPQVVQPHAGQLSIVFLQHIADRVEPLVELVEQRLVLGIICPLCHHIHVVEGKESELGADEVVLAGVSGHDVR